MIPLLNVESRAHNIIPFTSSQAENPSRFYRKQYKDYELITRASDGSRRLHSNARDLLIDYAGMINSSEYDFIVIDPDYVEDITGRKKYQNNEYHKQLADIFIIKFHHAIRLPFNNRMRKYTNVYTIQFTTNGREILKNPAAFYEGGRPQKHATSNGKPGDLEWKTRRSYIEYNNNIIINNKIDLDREDERTVLKKQIEKDLGVSIHGCKTPDEIPKPELSESDLSFNLNSKSDKETTMTTETLPEKGKLKDFYPLPESDYERLKQLSGRGFSLAEMNSILLKLSEKMKDKPKEPDFESRRQFMNYISKCLRMEKGQEGEIREYKLPEKKGQPIKREPIKGNQETAGKLTALVKAVFLEKNENNSQRCTEALEALDIVETKDSVKINQSQGMKADLGSDGLANVYCRDIFQLSYWTLQNVCEQYNFTVELTCQVSVITEEKRIITPETKKKDEAFRQRLASQAKPEKSNIRSPVIVSGWDDNVRDTNAGFKSIGQSISQLFR